jgi:TolB-like protein
MGTLFQELKRRNVYKVTTGYVVVSWLLLQIADTLFPAFAMPGNAIRVLAISLLFGFSLVLILAWAFELTPEGIKITKAATSEVATPLRTRDYLLSATLLLLIAVVIVQQLVIFNRPLDIEPIAVDEEVPESPSRVEELVASGVPADLKSVAILPFISLGSGEEDGYFADGLTNELLTRLAHVSGLKVPGRASTFYYKNRNQDSREIGRTLNVAHVLVGSVRRARDKLRISAELTDAVTGFRVWSANYDRTMNDIFAIQDDIAGAVISALQVKLMGEEVAVLQTHGTDNPEAQNLYLIATARLRELQSLGPRIQSNPELVSRTRDMFEEIVQLDPAYVDAWAGLVQILLELSNSTLLDGNGIMIERIEGLNLAREALASAQVLAPDAPSTLIAEATVGYASYRRNLEDEAELASVFDTLERAEQTEPTNVLILEQSGLIHARDGEVNEAIRLFDRVLELDPLSSVALDRAEAIGRIDRKAGRQQFKRIGDLHPDLPWQDGIARLEFQKGHLHHGIALAAERENNFTRFALASLGDREQALALIETGSKLAGGLGPVLDELKYLFQQDYAGLIAGDTDSEPDAVESLFMGVGSAVAAYRLRQFEVAANLIDRIDVGQFRRRSLADFADIHSIALDIAYILQQTGRMEQAVVIRDRFRENMASTLTGESVWHARAQHELDMLLLASEGQIEQALDAFEATYAEGWRWLMGPGQSLAGGFTQSASGYWFEDNPILDSIRDEPRFIATLNRIKADNAAMLAELNAGLSVEYVLNEEW